jgi:N-acetylglucosaminyldiphosphoundecaprenol N-acetyl-beta-D-mannosaminyltransferase
MRDLFNRLYAGGKNKFYAEMRNALREGGIINVVTANPETFMLAERDPRFRQALQSDSTVIIPDGIGVVMAARRLGMSINERIAGVELAEYLLRCADELRKRVFLYGAKPEVLAALEERLSRERPGAEIVGAYNGYDYSDEEIAEKIISRRPDIVMAGLGIPRQEIFLANCAKSMDTGILVGVGGAFDVMSGLKRRAPSIFIKLNLEWLYRIATEPKRLKRFFDNIIRVLFLYRKKTKGNQNG